eukprot:SAG31_NODE_2946_length_4874_cov_1.638534_1_plen_122_part_00
MNNPPQFRILSLAPRTLDPLQVDDTIPAGCQGQRTFLARPRALAVSMAVWRAPFLQCGSIPTFHVFCDGFPAPAMDGDELPQLRILLAGPIAPGCRGTLGCRGTAAHPRPTRGDGRMALSP